MIVELFHVKRTVEPYGTVAHNIITERSTIIKICTSHPVIRGFISRVGIQPVEDWQQVQRQLIRRLERLVIIQRNTEVADARPHRIFPCLIAVRIQVFVDRRIRLLYLRVCGTVECHVEILCQVPTQLELAVPHELLIEDKRKL